jgi:hypothetical protein
MGLAVSPLPSNPAVISRAPSAPSAIETDWLGRLSKLVQDEHVTHEDVVCWLAVHLDEFPAVMRDQVGLMFFDDRNYVIAEAKQHGITLTPELRLVVYPRTFYTDLNGYFCKMRATNARIITLLFEQPAKVW